MDVPPAALLRFPSSTCPEVLWEMVGSSGETDNSKAGGGIQSWVVNADTAGKGDT